MHNVQTHTHACRHTHIPIFNPKTYEQLDRIYSSYFGGLLFLCLLENTALLICMPMNESQRWEMGREEKSNILLFNFSSQTVAFGCFFSLLSVPLYLEFFFSFFLFSSNYLVSIFLQFRILHHYEDNDDDGGVDLVVAASILLIVFAALLLFLFASGCQITLNLQIRACHRFISFLISLPHPHGPASFFSHIICDFL